MNNTINEVINTIQPNETVQANAITKLTTSVTTPPTQTLIDLLCSRILEKHNLNLVTGSTIKILANISAHITADNKIDLPTDTIFKYLLECLGFIDICKLHLCNYKNSLNLRRFLKIIFITEGASQDKILRTKHNFFFLIAIIKAYCTNNNEMYALLNKTVPINTIKRTNIYHLLYSLPTDCYHTESLLYISINLPCFSTLLTNDNNFLIRENFIIANYNEDNLTNLINTMQIIIRTDPSIIAESCFSAYNIKNRDNPEGKNIAELFNLYKYLQTTYNINYNYYNDSQTSETIYSTLLMKFVEGYNATYTDLRSVFDSDEKYNAQCHTLFYLKYIMFYAQLKQLHIGNATKTITVDPYDWLDNVTKDISNLMGLFVHLLILPTNKYIALADSINCADIMFDFLHNTKSGSLANAIALTITNSLMDIISMDKEVYNDNHKSIVKTLFPALITSYAKNIVQISECIGTCSNLEDAFDTNEYNRINMLDKISNIMQLFTRLLRE